MPLDFNDGETEQWKSTNRGGMACLACRRRKTRCAPSTNPQGGSCEYCSGAGIACSLAPTPIGPPKTYVESLEQRLKATQELLRNLSTSAGVDLVGLANRPSTDPSTSQDLQLAKAALQQHAEGSRTRTPAHSTSSGGSPSSLNADGGGSQSRPVVPREYMPPERRIPGVFDGRFAGPSAGPALGAQFLDDYCGGQVVHADQSLSLVEDVLAHGSGPSSLSFALPPAELVQQLVNAYFTQVNEQQPILHWPSFNRDLVGGTASTDATFRSLLFIILAIGARWVSHPLLTEHWSAKGLYRASCTAPQVGAFGAAGATLYDLQAATLSVIYLMGAETSVSAWNAEGIAMRKFIDIGAHLESTERWTQSPLVDQLRKRAFHALHVADRFISASIGRPLAIQECDFTVKYPLSIDDEALDRWDLKPLGTPAPPSAPNLIGIIEYASKLASISTKTILRLYGQSAEQLTPLEMHSIVTEITAELKAWLESVPEHLRWEYAGPGAEAAFVGRSHLRALYAVASLTMCRPYIYNVVRRRGSSLVLLKEAFRAGGENTRTWNMIMRALLEKDKVHQCFYWIPVNSGFAILVGFHILRSVLVSNRYLLSVAVGLQTAIRAVQKLKDSTPEAAWAFSSAKILGDYVNRWRAAEGFDYSTFLTNPGPVSMAAYVNTPPFCYTDAQAALVHGRAPPTHSQATDKNLHPIDRPFGLAEAISTQEDCSEAQDFTVGAFSVPIRGEHFPFAPDGWVDLIGDSIPVIPEEVFSDEALPMVTEWLAEDW